MQIGNDLNQLLDLAATEQGITAAILPSTALGSTLDTATQGAITTINNGLNTALGTLVGLLQSLNSDTQVLSQGTTSTTTAPNGQSSQAHATPAQVVIGLPGAANLVALSLGKVDVTAARQVTTTNTAAVVPPTKTVKKVAAKPVAPTKRLAYTGADLPLSAGVALALLGAGGVLARRRRRVVNEI